MLGLCQFYSNDSHEKISLTFYYRCRGKKKEGKLGICHRIGKAKGSSQQFKLCLTATMPYHEGVVLYSFYFEPTYSISVSFWLPCIYVRGFSTEQWIFLSIPVYHSIFYNHILILISTRQVLRALLCFHQLAASKIKYPF